MLFRSVGFLRVPTIVSTRSRSKRHVQDDGSDSNYYRYTGGRWLFNEAQQLAARYVRFNIRPLVAIEPPSCIRIEKLPEGNFNKSLLLTMANGSQVVARFPNPNCGIPHYTTASEVATMDLFVLKALFGELVRAEYIVMEKVPGSSLAHVWPQLSNGQKRDIIQAIVKFEAKIVNLRLGGICGIKHLLALGLKDTCQRWVLGPTTDRRFFDDGRGELCLDRGHWNTAEEYITAICNRGYQPDCALKLSVCRDVLKVVDYIPPHDDCQVPVLWHKDLNLDNMFLDPERPTEINAHVVPLFDQITYPTFLDYKEPEPEGLNTPTLPENFEELDNDAKKHARKLLNPPYKDLLMKLASTWDELISSKGGPACPLVYSAAGIERQQELERKWVDGIRLMDNVLESLGGAVRRWDGWMSHEDYEALKQKTCCCLRTVH
ncbi:uncharacterized protein P174DRAFT_515774 [Aspergillus novofumigatus IBT 16806]|uniref:Altered inheritance of mitochondria protein 9, mitochondrial n=1 Tax=Aspergillus novofumigatus (strain IBT 16806) TaxID=1392255 RepID=A0A2I1BWH7_ASPN1|nr:uncharacterized protein P174DRAFT_515774 [Aspergillus novofumigatus IBT 16806]PKX89743.1 hypothetical protein P174DRAFT_515774 [Aspergillus novofumigatus IBT 16806]